MQQHGWQRRQVQQTPQPDGGGRARQRLDKTAVAL